MTAYPCPSCHTPADSVTGCPGCGRGPDLDAAEVIRLDAEIRVLNARLEAARTTTAALEGQLRQAWQAWHAAAARVRAKLAPPPITAPAPAPAPQLAPTQLAPHLIPPSALPSALPSGRLSAPPSGRPNAPLISPPARPGRSREASTRLVQNSLFLLGGLLLGVAAIVFTAVAWSQFGVGGRALLLAAFTGAALAAPPIAQRRGLTATAETFAAVGLLLVLLDGYAAWYVNLFGVADYSAFGYAGAVCAVTAAVAAGYEQLTGLIGPRFVALLVAQPVLPLLAVPLHFAATGWSFTFLAVTLVNLAVVHLRHSVPTPAAHLRHSGPAPVDPAVHLRHSGPAPADLAAGVRHSGLAPAELAVHPRRSRVTPVGVTAYVLGGCSVLLGGSAALLAVGLASRPVPALAAGLALIGVVLVVLAAAILSRVAELPPIAAALLVIAVAVAAGRFADVAGGRYLAPVLIPAVATLLAFAVLLLPPVIRRGPWIGALIVVGLPATYVLAGVQQAIARPFSPEGDWRQPAALVLLVSGLTALLPAAWRRTALLIGVALLALAAPAGFGLPWWSAPALDLAVAAGALALIVRVTGSFGWRLAVVVTLAAHAIGIGYGRPLVAALTLGAVTLLGFGAAVAAWSGPRRGDVGGVSLAVGLLALPALAGTAPAQPSRLALAAATLIFAVFHLVARRYPDYRPFTLAAALLGVLSAPVWAIVSGDSAAIYSGVALLLIATTLTAPRWWAIPAAVPPAVALLAATGASQLNLLAGPYAELDRIWAGPPGGTGLGRIPVEDVLAGGLLALAVGLGAFLLGGRRTAPAVRAAAPILAVTAPGALAAAGTPWPIVPAAMLLLGLTGLLAIALDLAGRPGLRSARPGVEAAGVAVESGRPGVESGRSGLGLLWRYAVGVVSTLLALAGLAAALPTRWSTLVALAAVLIAGATAGATGRELPARLLGWCTAITAGLAFAFTAGRAADLPLHATAFPVLGAAALTLALGALLTTRRPLEARAVQAAAHAGAVAALLLTVGEPRFAAVVCTLWGLAIGLRALRPGEAVTTRRLLIVAAAAAELGGWLLLAGADRVSVLEAYTIPIALVALLAGWLARRTREGLSSWAAYGPALIAALGPTLASVLAEPGVPMRRLLLGLAALAVVLLGARARLQAPVVIGGSALAAVALHEIALVWDLLPRWIPLAAAGLLLIALAMTLERRRRDLARVRAALTRMG